MSDARFFELDFGHGSVPFAATMVPDVDGRRSLLLAGHPDDDLLVYGSSLPQQPVPDAQTMLHAGDLIRALAFELPITFDQAYASDLEPLGPYWRLRHVDPSTLANAFDVVMTAEGTEDLATATLSFGPVHRTQLEPVAEYAVTVSARELLEVIPRIMGVSWRADR